jgi:hypothetical protein
MFTGHKELICCFLTFLATFAAAGICPLEEHLVCNENEIKHRCVCAMTMEENPPPEQSCNIVVDIQDDEFPAASVTFKINDAANAYDDFPEEKFREELATALRVEEDHIILLRLRCSENNEEFIVQFAVLKKDVPSDIELPYEKEHFVDAKTLVTKMNSLGQLSQQIAQLEVDKIEHVEELWAIESGTDNTVLIIEAVAVTLFMLSTCLCGCWIACKRSSEYEDELQKV